jgi:hypothetical protein
MKCEEKPIVNPVKEVRSGIADRLLSVTGAG